MRCITFGLSLLTLLLSASHPALAEREGLPGRRVGGGTRWQSLIEQPVLNLTSPSQTQLWRARLL